MAITALPTPPSRQDPANFADRADAFLGQLPTFATEANALQADVTSKQTTASTAATNAANSASAASTSATNAANSATAAANSAASALTAPGTSATSTTELAISTGSKTLTIQTGKSFVVGQPVIIANTVNPSTIWMSGHITAYNSGTGSLTVDVVWGVGGGVGLNSWTVSLAGPSNPNLAFKDGTGATGTWGIGITGSAAVHGEVVNAGTTNFTAVAGKHYLVRSAGLGITLPASPAIGATIRFTSYVSGWTILRNGKYIMSAAEDLVVDKGGSGQNMVTFDLKFIEDSANIGWVII